MEGKSEELVKVVNDLFDFCDVQHLTELTEGMFVSYIATDAFACQGAIERQNDYDAKKRLIEALTKMASLSKYKK